MGGELRTGAGAALIWMSCPEVEKPVDELPATKVAKPVGEVEKETKAATIPTFKKPLTSF